MKRVAKLLGYRRQRMHASTAPSVQSGSAVLNEELMTRVEDAARKLVFKEPMVLAERESLGQQLRSLNEDDQNVVTAHMERTMVEAICNRLYEKAPRQTQRYIETDPNRLAIAHEIFRISKLREFLQDPETTRLDAVKYHASIARHRARLVYFLAQDTNRRVIGLHILCTATFIATLFIMLRHYNSHHYGNFYLEIDAMNVSALTGFSAGTAQKWRGRRLTKAEKSMWKQDPTMTQLALNPPNSTDFIETLDDFFWSPDCIVDPRDDHLLMCLTKVRPDLLPLLDTGAGVGFASFVEQEGLS
ncbi:hypothetical protein DIPPA_28075 [Diplonema papillatum]|nr:hypothetical protein DIPPA_28075 [Diplonema papillatum]